MQCSDTPAGRESWLPAPPVTQSGDSAPATSISKLLGKWGRGDKNLCPPARCSTSVPSTCTIVSPTYTLLQPGHLLASSCLFHPSPQEAATQAGSGA